MDFLFLFIFFLSLYFLRQYFIRQQTSDLVTLSILIVWLGHTRYEGLAVGFMLYVAVPFLVKLNQKAERYYCLSWVFIGALLVPDVCQQIISLDKHQNAPGQPLFGLSYFRKNTLDFLSAIFNLSGHSFFSSFLTISLMAVVTGALIRGLRLNRFTVTAISIIALHQLFMLFHLDSFASHPYSARFFLPFALAAALSPLSILYFFPRTKNFLLTLALINLFTFYSIAVTARDSRQLPLNLTTENALRFLKAQAEENIVVVTELPGIFAALDFGALSFDWVRQHPSFLFDPLQQGLIDKAYAIQVFDKSKNLPWKDHELPEGFTGLPKWEFERDTQTVVRISEISKN